MTDAPTTVACLTCERPVAERLADLLGESLDADEAISAAFEGDNGRWVVAIYFRTQPNEAAVRALVAACGDAALAKTLTFETVAERDWVAASLTGLAPVRAGRIVVHGAHDRARIVPNAIAIEIEAALAFGTGHHGSTRGCLLAIDALARKTRARNILDLGTGSGVLAIAAARLFRSRVLAVDIDPRAVAAARANAQRNRVGNFVTVQRANGTGSRRMRADAPFDLVLANILLDPLVRMAVPLSRLTAPGGYLVLSGLLPRQANAALAIYSALGLALERRIGLDSWVTLVMRRPAASQRRQKMNQPRRCRGCVHSRATWLSGCRADCSRSGTCPGEGRPRARPAAFARPSSR